jgi:hypothetical protein
VCIVLFTDDPDSSITVAHISPSSVVDTQPVNLADPTATAPSVLIPPVHSSNADEPRSAAADSVADTIIQCDFSQSFQPLSLVNIQPLASLTSPQLNHPPSVNDATSDSAPEAMASHDESVGNQQPSTDFQPPRKRARTTAAKITNAKEKHHIQPGCGDQCRRKCNLKLSEERRGQIHNSYWQMTYNKRRIWQSRLIKRKEVKRHRRCKNSALEVENCKRTNSFWYFLPSETGDNEVAVCQKFFVATLGYTSNRLIVEMKYDSEYHVLPAADKRGKHPAAHKVHSPTIEAHIASFNPQVSHYRREHAPNRRYLPNNLTITSMFQDFRSKHLDVKCSAETYRKAISASNISFAQPENDQCDDCAYYMHAEQTNEIKEKFEKHKTMAQKARENYRADAETMWPDDTAVYATDLQKVLLLPYLHDLKSCVFTSRLVVFNETFARMGNHCTGKHLLAVWDESIAGRKKEDIASAYHSMVEKQRDITKMIFWLDNCSAQNKNWTLYSMFLKVVNNSNSQQHEITLKYLVPGHTHMMADSIHGHIEKKLRRARDVYDLKDLIEIMNKATKSNEVMQLNISNFRDWPNNIVTRTKNNKLPLLADVVQVRFVRGDSRIFYKTDIDGDEIAISVLKKAAEKTLTSDVIPENRKCPRGIAAAKKQKILKELASRMPPNRRYFWQTLPECELSEDLLKTFE